MIESIERMRKLVNDNLVMGLRFQMNRELNKLESEIEQELNSRAERTCHIEHPYYGDAPVINGQPRCSECETEFAVGAFPHYCPNCGCKVVGE